MLNKTLFDKDKHIFLINEHLKELFFKPNDIF